MEFRNRKSVSDELKKYDGCFVDNEHAFIEVTQWSNGEGFDILISDKDERRISITYGELEAINYLVKSLDYRDDKNS